MDLHVRSLRNSQEYSDDKGISEAIGISTSNWSLFGVLWGSSVTLARLMQSYSIAGRRVLEVGCGLGLASLVLSKRDEDVSATDYHPNAEEFLEINATLNNTESIPFVRANWADGSIGLGDFDLIIGSDLLYERDQPEALSAFIDLHARPTCEVIMVDPGRGQLSRFGRLMAERGYTDVLHEKSEFPAESEPARVQTHSYFRGPRTAQA